MEKFKSFNDWWSAYCKVSSLNKIHLSFIDVDILRKEMEFAFSRTLPVKGEENGCKAERHDRKNFH